MRQLKKQLDQYMREHKITEPTRADLVLAYLRINTPLALDRAQQIMGKPITRCPPAIPPWPPKPVQKKQVPIVARVDQSRFSWTVRTSHRKIKPGMTRDQLRTNGLSSRDILDWTRSGRIEWRTA
jgi:hypothetical protein